MKRFFVTTGILGVLAGGGFGAWLYFQANDEPEYLFESSKVDRGAVVSKVTATGTLSALVTVQVGSQVSGRIQKTYVDFNSPVRRGQLIAKIDPALFVAAVAQGKANVAAAKGNLAVAKVRALDGERQWKRSQELARKGLVAPIDLDTAEANAKAAAAQVEAADGALAQAVANLNQAKINLGYTNIISPTSGVVISRNVDVGQTVAASFQSPVLFLIAEDLRKMQVDTNVAEADVGKLRPEMSATFKVDAYPNERFRGVVRQIRNAPQTLQNVVTYDAVIDVHNDDLKLRPGMTANVTFVWAERGDALRVPNGALRFRPPRALRPKPDGGDVAGGALDGGPVSLSSDGGAVDGGEPAVAHLGDGGAEAARRARDGGVARKVMGRGKKRRAPDRKTVWVLEGATLRPVEVRTGITDGHMTEILEGALRSGDRVVTEAVRKKGGKRPRGAGFKRIM